MPEQNAGDEERQAVLGRLTAIEHRQLADRSLTPGEAHTIIAWIGELQLYGLQALAERAALPTCPVWGEARGTSSCEVCGGDIVQCPIYGRGERRRLEAEAAR